MYDSTRKALPQRKTYGFGGVLKYEDQVLCLIHEEANPYRLFVDFDIWVRAPTRLPESGVADSLVCGRLRLAEPGTDYHAGKAPLAATRVALSNAASTLCRIAKRTRQGFAGPESFDQPQKNKILS